MLRTVFEKSHSMARRSACLGFPAGVSVFCIAWGAASDRGAFGALGNGSRSGGCRRRADTLWRVAKCPVHLGNTPFYKPHPGVPALLVHIVAPKSVGVRFLPMQSGPMGGGDHESEIGSNGSIVPRGRYTCFGSRVDRRVWFCGDR